MESIIAELASGDLTPVIQDDNVTFGSSTSGNTRSAVEDEEIVVDVRFVATIDNQDIYQATYVRGVNLESSREDTFYGTKSYLSCLYTKLDAEIDSVPYYRVINAKAGSVDIGGTALIKNMSFGIHSWGLSTPNASTPTAIKMHDQSSGEIATVKNGAGYSLYNTDSNYYAVSGIEGSIVSSMYQTTTSGSKQNMINIKFGMTDIS